MAEALQVIQAERSRTLPSTVFVASSIQSIDIPKDSVFKSLEITLSGGFSITFTGTYTTDPLVSMGRLIARMDIVIDGSRYVKSVTPWICATKQLFASATLGERKSSAGASVLNPANPTADAGLTVGTTGQISTIRESVSIFFEDVLSLEPREGTFLNTKGRSSAELRFTFAAFSAVEAANNAATAISYAANTLIVDVTTREAPHLDGKFSDLKETTKAVQFSAQVTDSAVDINRGNFLRGIWMQVRDGVAAKSLSNNAVTRVVLQANGFIPLKVTSFFKIQAENRNQWGLNVPLVSNASRVDGVAYLDLLQNRKSGTALDTRKMDNLQLLLSTAAAGAGATYTNPVEVTLQTDEYVISG